MMLLRNEPAVAPRPWARQQTLMRYNHQISKWMLLAIDFTQTISQISTTTHDFALFEYWNGWTST